MIEHITWDIYKVPTSFRKCLCLCSDSSSPIWLYLFESPNWNFGQSRHWTWLVCVLECCNPFKRFTRKWALNLHAQAHSPRCGSVGPKSDWRHWARGRPKSSFETAGQRWTRWASIQIGLPCLWTYDLSHIKGIHIIKEGNGPCTTMHRPIHLLVVVRT